MKLICNLPAKQIKAIYAKYEHHEDRFDALVEAERDEMEWGSYPTQEKEKEEPLTDALGHPIEGYDDAYFDQLLKDEEADTFFWPNGIHMYCENASTYFNRPDIYNPQRDDTY